MTIKTPSDLRKRNLRWLAKTTKTAWQSDRLAERAVTAARLSSLAERGLVAIAYGVPSDDGSRIEEGVDFILANPIALERWLGDFYDGDTCPQWHELRRISDLAAS